ncbi:MAG: CPBP family glutamic-type intramembrane protease [Hyphomicrobiaceae bacterium]
MNKLEQLEFSKWFQALASAIVCALYHSIWSFHIEAFIASIVFGLVLSGLFLWGKQSLSPVICCHVLAVLISEPFATKLLFWTAAL